MNRYRSFQVVRLGALTLALAPFAAGLLTSACGAADGLPQDNDAIGSLPTSTGTSKPSPTSTGTTKPSPTSTGTTKPTPTSTGTSKPTPTSTGSSTSNPPPPPPPPPPPKKNCDYEGTSIPHGTKFPAVDGCNTCSCQDGSLACTEIGCTTPTESACILDGKVYESGSSNVPDPESCNSCTCDNGKITSCTEIGCPLPKPCRLGRAIYRHGSSFVNTDGTTQCRCTEGELVCTAIP